MATKEQIARRTAAAMTTEDGSWDESGVPIQCPKCGTAAIVHSPQIGHGGFVEECECGTRIRITRDRYRIKVWPVGDTAMKVITSRHITAYGTATLFAQWSK